MGQIAQLTNKKKRALLNLPNQRKKKMLLSISSLFSSSPISLKNVLPSQNFSIICMANQRRVKMVAKQIRRELSDMLLTDKVIKYAVLPEASLGADRYLSSLTTISDVVVSGDLQVFLL